MKSYVLNSPSKIFDILQRFDDTDKLFLLQGQNPKLALNPVSTLSMRWDNIEIEKIKHFCKTNQSQKNLVIGMLSYDLGLYMHNLSPKNKNNFPLVCLYAFENWLEEENGEITVKYNDDLVLDKLKKLAKNPPLETARPRLVESFDPSWTIQEYSKSFDKVSSFIKSGDIYQINLSYAMTARTSSSARDIFIETQKVNQAEMAGLFQTPDFDIISLSPETFMRIKNKHIETFPIKGTEALRENVTDEETISSLIDNKKEQAELNMISDLLRNDLSMVCRAGSVKIKSRRNTTKLKNVIHTYSHITGELDDQFSSIDALMKTIPGGSISGCPKKRALEIIDQVEDYSRGPYTGVMFTLTPNDKLESSILIRTILKKGEDITLAVGGGIVFDSDCRSEYQETLDKASPIVSAFA